MTTKRVSDVRGADLLHGGRCDVVLVVALELVEELEVAQQLHRRRPEVVHHLACSTRQTTARQP